MSSLVSNRTALDHFGIIVASICLLHCLAIPIAVLAAPTMTVYAPDNEWLHLPLVLFAATLGGYAMLVGKARHQQSRPIIIASIGILLLLVSLAEAQIGGLAEYLASIGAIMMAYAHIKNMRAICICCPD
ncbi:MerC domain-containing protein [Kordiimonas aquimaris]|uniref:MerC domain-containing protein n=1 Tax=Kordiimonas aquimaris TaxID=707591 RepID=UPI0021D148DE|nr:MerC domain-containing protein [Kordiimonas aquimaris]